MHRRSFLQLVGIAPAVILTPGLLMSVRPLKGVLDLPPFSGLDLDYSHTRIISPHDGKLIGITRQHPDGIIHLYDNLGNTVEGAYSWITYDHLGHIIDHGTKWSRP